MGNIWNKLEDSFFLEYYQRGWRGGGVTKGDKIFYLPSAPIRQKTAAVFWKCFDDINYFRNAASKKSLEVISIIKEVGYFITDNVK